MKNLVKVVIVFNLIALGTVIMDKDWVGIALCVGVISICIYKLKIKKPLHQSKGL